MAEQLLQAGLNALKGYVALHVLTCLVPAFLLAGAIVSFVSRETIIGYLGSAASKIKSFVIAGGVALPAVFAIGTGLPVLVFGTLLSAGVARVSTWLNAVTHAEKIIRIIVSIVFIGVGIYYVVLWIQA